MAVYEFNPTEKQIEDYIPFLSGMTEKEFKELISDVREIFVNNSYKIISRRMDWYFAYFSYSLETLYNNLIPFLLMNDLARVFKYKGHDGIIYKFIIVFKQQGKEEDTISIVEKILEDIFDPYKDFIEIPSEHKIEEINNLVEQLEELHW